MVFNANQCEWCHGNCHTCSGPDETNCLSCYGGYYLTSPGNECIGDCAALGGTIVIDSNSVTVCQIGSPPPPPPCDLTCQTCVSGQPNQCLSCFDGSGQQEKRYLDGTVCVQACVSPKYTFEMRRACVESCPVNYPG